MKILIKRFFKKMLDILVKLCYNNYIEDKKRNFNKTEKVLKFLKKFLTKLSIYDIINI